MAGKTQLTGVEAVISFLNKKQAEAQKGAAVQVAVGFSQSYAIYVHENLEAHHPIGQAKFLEQPARQNSKKYGEIVTNAMKSGGTMEDAMLMAGLELQADAQKLCPVDTGALKNSAYTVVEPLGS